MLRLLNIGFAVVVCFVFGWLAVTCTPGVDHIYHAVCVAFVAGTSPLISSSVSLGRQLQQTFVLFFPRHSSDA